MLYHKPFATQLAIAALAWSIATFPGQAEAHGSVTPDADVCIIEIGFYRAHFKIYQPESRGHRDYCEDLPAAGRSLFVMEYEHTALSDAEIEFRVIENRTGLGRFARLSDIQRLDNLDALTVLLHGPERQRDVFMAEHTFADTGEYIGIVNVTNPETGKRYTAVFPFEVGYTDFGYWPHIAIVALLLQLNYLGFTGRLHALKRLFHSGTIA